MMLSSRAGMSISENQKDILSEHLRLLETKPEYDGGLTLHVSNSHDDEMHVMEHKRFKAENPDMGMKSKMSLDNHISKHVMSQMEKQRLGLDTTSYPDNVVDEGDVRVRTHISPGG